MNTKGGGPVPLLQARDLVKTYGRNPALRGASVDLGAGEILAVTGPSGSGKSTLLHCLAGIVRPDRGSVDYRGERLDQLSEQRLSELRRTDFGVVFQFGQLIPELTAVDNVALPLLLAETARAAARERAGEWLEETGVCARSRARERVGDRMNGGTGTAPAGGKRARAYAERPALGAWGAPRTGSRGQGERKGPDHQAEMPSIRAMASSAPNGCK
ncbi:ATP-binding cassette domain-containing protein [Streptomyces sp. NPDC059766]|uniref:ATP-binding cassette domain-containing protein n=1 Tax=Streptomyces sp. NPDC059766 TaxID=3346940 RepID=UPI00366395C5